MEYLIPILIAAIGGICFVVYRHPEHGRKIINYIFPVLAALCLLLFIYFMGLSSGISRGGVKTYDESLFNKRLQTSSDLLLYFGAGMILSLLLWKGLDWLSHLFEDAKKTKNSK